MTIHVQAESPETCPALVLNADFRPLSYYPLSIWCWQDAIKAVFLDRVNIVSEYETLRAQPVVRNAPALGRLAQELRQAFALSRLHAFQRVLARPLHLPVLRRSRRSHLRPRGSALERRRHQLGERRRGLFRLQSQEGRPAALGRADVARRASPISRRCTTSIGTAGCSRPTTSTAPGWTISIGIANCTTGRERPME